MKTVQEVFNAAMGLMDELDREGNAQTKDTKEYEYRTPAIVNTLIAEKRILFGEHGNFNPVEEMDDDLIGIDDVYALGVMQYGLAAKLLLDENPASASFYHQKYEQEMQLYAAREQSGFSEIEDVYGGIEYGQFSRW